jgi:uncharacterized protein YuzE
MSRKPLEFRRHAETEHQISYCVLRPQRAKAVMMLKIIYRPKDSAAYIRLSPGKVLESAEVAPDVVFDYDAEGRIVGIELLDAKAQLSPELLSEAA